MAKKLTNKERKEIAEMVDHMQNCCPNCGYRLKDKVDLLPHEKQHMDSVILGRKPHDET